MKVKLNPHEARVIGVLMEKAITTPDQYPMSLNALTNACNQKSNRHPVISLSEATVQATVDALRKRYLVSDQSGFGSRVTKYQHRFCNSAFGSLQLSAGEVAIICELLLRGPQTPGELRSRAERLHAFRDVDEVESSLRALSERDEPLVARLAREPGKREARYAHLLGDEPPPPPTLDDDDGGLEATTPADQGRLAALEGEVKGLRLELERLRQLVEGGN